jgi:hypothetical protein
MNLQIEYRGAGAVAGMMKVIRGAVDDDTKGTVRCVVLRGCGAHVLNSCCQRV